MPNKNYRRGADKERRLVNDFKALGMLAFRSAGSHSPIDVFALDPKEKKIYLVQCKTYKARMSEKAKNAILEPLKAYIGDYSVRVALV